MGTKSKHRKGFKERKQKNFAKKIADKKLIDHNIKKYREQMIDQIAREQAEKLEDPVVVHDETYLPITKAIDGIFLDAIEINEKDEIK